MTDNRALYRKYRPEAFADVFGQDQLVAHLQKAITEEQPAHAYIFAGTRGVGKTTLARIFAKELGVSEKDTYELDAASNNSVDDIRDLRESVATLPFESDYKVYILDEAHMLSKSAFNALLKTLEEPPAYCIFILATTEPEKLPQTIHSRAQLHSLKSPSRKEITAVIKKVATSEGYTFGEGADDLIAVLGNGSFRDALSTLQKVLGSAKAKSIVIDEVEQVTGAPRGALLNDILTGLAQGSADSALEALQTLVQSGADITLSIELLLERARAVLLLRHGSPKVKALLEESWGKDDLVELAVLAKQEGSLLKASAVLALLQAQQQMRFASIRHLPLELAVITLTQE